MPHKSIFLQMIGLGLLLAILVASPAPAQDKPDDKPADPGNNDNNTADKFSKALDECESALDSLEELARFGSKKVTDYAAELEDEYRQNKLLLEQPQENEHDARIHQERSLRQKIILLYLWELERVGPLIANVDQSSRSMTSKLHKLFQENRDAIKDRNLMQRYFNLSRRSSQMMMRGMQVRMAGGFYLVQPEDGEHSANLEPKKLAQQSGEQTLQLTSGPLQELRKPLQRMLKLRWSGASIVADQDHWDDPFCGKTFSTISNEVKVQLKQRGVTLPDDDKSNSRLRRMPFRTEEPSISLLFQNLHHQAISESQNTSGGGGGGSGRWHRHFSSSEITANMTIKGNSLDLILTEVVTPNRSLRVSSDDRELRIGLLGDHVMLLDQQPDGKVRLVITHEDEVASASAESFATLYVEHPEMIEQSLFPILDHLGFLLPPTRMDPLVVDRVIEALRIVDDATQERFEKLLEQTDSSSFTVRAKATHELESNLSTYLKLIRRAYRDEELSAEVKTRLKHVLEEYEQETADLDRLIIEMKLTGDMAYLISLLGRVQPDQQDMIVAHLEKETGEALGSDQDAWQDWLDQANLAE